VGPDPDGPVWPVHHCNERGWPTPSWAPRRRPAQSDPAGFRAPERGG
jgi:hypothetical protein